MSNLLSLVVTGTSLSIRTRLHDEDSGLEYNSIILERNFCELVLASRRFPFLSFVTSVGGELYI